LHNLQKKLKTNLPAIAGEGAIGSQYAKRTAGAAAITGETGKYAATGYGQSAAPQVLLLPARKRQGSTGK
jgi:hypothetical protein